MLNTLNVEAVEGRTLLMPHVASRLIVVVLSCAGVKGRRTGAVIRVRINKQPNNARLGHSACALLLFPHPQIDSKEFTSPTPTKLAKS